MTQPAPIDIARFRVAPDTEVDLADWPTRVDPLYADRADYKDGLKAGTKALLLRMGLTPLRCDVASLAR